MARTPDYSTWVTKQQAAEAIGVTTKTIERLAQDGQVQQARWRRQTGGPDRAVYHPGDVARIAETRRQGPPAPFLVPAAADAPAPTTGNGAAGLVPAPAAPLPGDDVLRLVFAAALRAVSETSETSALFLTLAQASAVSGLSEACLRRLIAAQTLPAIRDRGWRIRRRDLEAL